jgi:hypothetical protein
MIQSKMSDGLKKSETKITDFMVLQKLGKF